MSKEKSPSFQWFPRDYMTDSNVMLMDMCQRGVYHWLLNICWLEISLPADIGSLSRLSGVSVDWWERFGSLVLACFFPNKSGRLEHTRLNHEREMQRVRREKQSNAGKKGMARRWSKPLKTKDGNKVVIDSLIRSDNSSSSSSSSYPPIIPLVEGRDNGIGFDQFWAVYPRKIARTSALKAWLKIKPAPALLTEILDAIRNQAKGEQWSDRQFIPYPASWLNGRRWEDVLTSKAKPTSNGQKQFDLAPIPIAQRIDPEELFRKPPDDPHERIDWEHAVAARKRFMQGNKPEDDDIPQ